MLKELWDRLTDKLVTLRFLEFMEDFGIIKSALLFFSLPFCVIMLFFKAPSVGYFEVIFVSLLLGLPGWGILAMVIGFISVFECIARSLLMIIFDEN